MTDRLEQLWRDALVAKLRMGYGPLTAMAAADEVVRGFQTRFPKAGEPAYK